MLSLLPLDGSPASLNCGWDERVVEGDEHYGGCEIEESERREWDLGPVQPDTSFRHAPPPVKKYSSTHIRVCLRVRVHVLCIFYLLVMVAVVMVLLEPTSIAKLPILLRDGGTTVILSDISQGQSLLLYPSVSLFHRRGADETRKWI